MPNSEETPFTIVEIRDWYLQAHQSPWYQSQLPVTKKVMMDVADVSQGIIDALEQYDDYLKANTIERLTRAIRGIEDRRIIWVEDSMSYAGVSSYRICYLTRPPAAPKRIKFAPKDEFDVHSVCTSCGGNKWMPGRVDGKAFAMCYSCVPPSQYASLGATVGKYSLIAEYARLNDARLHLLK